MVAAGGGVVFAAGVLYLSQSAGDDVSNTKSIQATGLALMGTGLAIAITGGIIGIVGHNEKKRYGWKIIAPNTNEIGVAYNFSPHRTRFKSE
jgi:hypothetical protein